MTSSNHRRVLVTGAGRGIGRAICETFAAEGYTIVAVSRSCDELKQSLSTTNTTPSTHEYIECDLANTHNIATYLKDVAPVHVVVNNAGITKLAPLLEMSLDDFQAVMQVNVMAAFEVTKIMAQKMIEAKFNDCSIVNVSSQASTRAFPLHVAYCTSKGALDQLTRMSALELAPHRIRVNAVNPTVVLTDMGKAAWSDPQKAAPMLSRIPQGKFAEPNDVARAVLYLTQADMVNGITLPIDGGFLIT